MGEQTDISFHESMNHIIRARECAQLAEKLLLNYPQASKTPKLVATLLEDGWKELIRLKQVSKEDDQSVSLVNAFNLKITRCETASQWSEIVESLSKLIADQKILVSHSRLRRWIKDLKFACREQRGFCYEKFGKPSSLKVALRILAALAVVLCLAYAAYCYTRPAKVWRISFFHGTSLSGNVVGTRFARHIDFDWTFQSPVPGIGESRYSAKLETCLKLNEAQTVKFKLGSDDGSRLYFNDKLVMNRWKPSAFDMVDGQAQLPKGYHYLRIDFFQELGSSEIKFDILSNQSEGKFELLPIFNREQCQKGSQDN